MEAKDEIKARLDVAEIVGEFIELKPSGTAGFKAVCPFHQEKTPSLHVSKEKQIWHCFGCHKGGDIFTFVMEMEGVDFIDALKQLAKKAGVTLPEMHASKKKNTENKLSSDLQELATKFYEAILWKSESAKIARDYLEKRGINNELAKKFRLGYAPDAWDGFITFAKQRGIFPERLVKSGLAKNRRSGTGAIDQFRARIMIPICDRHGNVAGFTGRILQDQEHAPKYLNSPESPLFQKRELLYGLHLAKTAIRIQDSVIIVEGNLDVIASHKAGVEHVVASSGTALTEMQIRQLKKLTQNLIFAFDADNAGFKAAKRGIAIATSLGMQVSVIEMPDSLGSDPDDIVQKDPEAWVTLSKTTLKIMEFYFNRAMKQYDTTTVDGKKAMANFIITELRLVDDIVEVEHWLQKLSDIIHVKTDLLRSALQGKKPRRQNTKKVEENSMAQKRLTKEELAGSVLVGLAIVFEDMQKQIFTAEITSEQMPKPWGEIYKKLKTAYTADEHTDPSQKNKILRDYDQLIDYIGTKYAEHIQSAIMRAEQVIEGNDHDQVRQEVNQYIDVLTLADSTKKRQLLEAAIRETEQSGDTQKLQSLLKEYQDLLRS